MTTAKARAAARVTYQLETLWDYDYEPTHAELETLYETAKKNQWNGSTAIDWSHRPGAAGPVLNVQATRIDLPTRRAPLPGDRPLRVRRPRPLE